MTAQIEVLKARGQFEAGMHYLAHLGDPVAPPETELGGADVIGVAMLGILHLQDPEELKKMLAPPLSEPAFAFLLHAAANGLFKKYIDGTPKRYRPEEQVNTFALYFLSPYSMAEIAEFIDLPTSAVSNRILNISKTIWRSADDETKKDLDYKNPFRHGKIKSPLIRDVRKGNETVEVPLDDLLDANTRRRHTRHTASHQRDELKDKEAQSRRMSYAERSDKIRAAEGEKLQELFSGVKEGFLKRSRADGPSSAIRTLTQLRGRPAGRRGFGPVIEALIREGIVVGTTEDKATPFIAAKEEERARQIPEVFM